MTDSVYDTASELGRNGSLVLNEAGEEVASTLNQLGQNMNDVGSEIGSEILNETEETAKKGWDRSSGCAKKHNRWNKRRNKWEVGNWSGVTTLLFVLAHVFNYEEQTLGCYC